MARSRLVRPTRADLRRALGTTAAALGILFVSLVLATAERGDRDPAHEPESPGVGRHVTEPANPEPPLPPFDPPYTTTGFEYDTRSNLIRVYEWEERPARIAGAEPAGGGDEERAE